MRSKPKKRLGQNFLVDENIKQKIARYCDFKPSDTVLEIGAGRGELTRLFADSVKKIYALEIDADLYGYLKDSLRGYKNAQIIKGDILKFDLKKYFNPRKGKVKVFGNIPYYITSPILERLLRYKGQIDTIFITVQKEFAERICACAGSKDYSSFSCFIQYYARPQILFTIKRNSFFPRPKVDSCFLRLDIRRTPAVKVKNEKLFFKVIRAAFNKRRKTLRNSLKGIIGAQKLELFFGKYGIDRNIRPERLSLCDLANLTNQSS